MATPNPSTEQRELELVEKVELRILKVCNNEKKLTELLAVYLAPLLLKAGSPHASVRNEVVTLCNRLKIFIHAPGVILPVGALLDQYKSTDSPLVKHFDLLFAHHSVGRLTPVQRSALIPRVVQGISEDTGTGVKTLFRIFLRLLLDLNIPPRGSADDDACREAVGFSSRRGDDGKGHGGDSSMVPKTLDPEACMEVDDPGNDSSQRSKVKRTPCKDAAFIASWIGKLLLLRPKAGPQRSPGLTEDEAAFLTLSGTSNSWELAEANDKDFSLARVRIKAVQFLASGAFTDEERFVPAIMAVVFPDYRVSDIGEEILKRCTVDLEDADVVRTLFSEHAKLPAPYRIRILGLLSKSEASAEFTDEILNVFKLNVGGAGGAGGHDGAASAAGLEQTKVHRALFEYINWVARAGTWRGKLVKISPALINLLRQFIEDQGWPRPQRSSADDEFLRSRAYEAIGRLTRASKDSREPADLAMARWLFRSLAEDPTHEVVVNVDAALTATAGMFHHDVITADTSTALRSMLVEYMTMPDEADLVVRSARHAAVKWANLCFPFDDPVARWIDILAVTRKDERSDVVEEGQRGLDPCTYGITETSKLPRWDEMVRVFFDDAVLADMVAKTPKDGEGNMEIDDRSIFANFPRDGLRAASLAVDYCEKMLFLTALKRFKMEAGWEGPLERLMQSDVATRRTVAEYLATTTHVDGVVRLLTAALEGMNKDDAVVCNQCGKSFVDLVSLASRSVVEKLSPRTTELMPLIKSNNRTLRSLGARAFGILGAHPVWSEEEFDEFKHQVVAITRNWEKAVGSELNAIEGAFVALARLVSRRSYYMERMDTRWAVELGDVIPSLESVRSALPSFQEALFETYSQLWMAGIRVGGGDVSGLVEKLGKEYVEPLLVHAKKGNEKAISALGHLAMAFGDVDEGIIDHVLEKLYGLYEIKQAEVHFSVGGAITAAVARWDAEPVQLVMDVSSQPSGPRRVSWRVTAVLDKLLADSKQTKPSLLKASGIWLFCLIQHCSHLEEVQSRLRDSQRAFLRLLGARDELVQETASRGLALAYEKGDQALKGELVRDLVSAFTGSATQLKVDDDTELFEAGALPTGEGKSITSYRDIVNLANEVGDQTLVYKLMSMATNAATWSTRSAFGRFGLSDMLSEEEMDPKLYPKLYRYRFDPNTNVRRSMEDIWKALVKDSKAVLDTWFDDIMKDLLVSILAKEWRVREASCAALSDLVAGRPFPKYEKYYKDMWQAALKVMDDVKATVRAAALRLCMAMSTTLERQLEDGGSGAASAAMIKEAIPFLLSERAIESSVAEVQVFTARTIIAITKKGGRGLKPFLAQIITRFLGLLSTIEPEAINYHYQRSHGDTRDEIDQLRSKLVGMSPIMEAIENCLIPCDGAVLEELMPALENAMKTALGMPTKIGCSRVVMTLSTRHASSFGPYAPRLLQLTGKLALDGNDQVSQGYARAAAYLIRVVPADAQLAHAEKITALYLAAEDDVRRQKAADMVAALSRHSPDHFTALEASLMPLAYLGRRDEHDGVAELLRTVWDERGGSATAARRFASDIATLAGRALDSPQWALRQAGALAVADAVDATTKDVTVATDDASTTPPALRALWPAYSRALALKTFPRKDQVLAALPGFVRRSKAWWRSEPRLADELAKIATREAKRNNDAYRPRAFELLAAVAAERDDLDLLDEIADIVRPYYAEVGESDDMDVDEPRGRGPGQNLKTDTAQAAVAAVGGGYNRGQMRDNPSSVMQRVAALLSDGMGKACIAGPWWDVMRRAFWYDRVKELMDEAAVAALGEKKVDGRVAAWFLGTLDVDTPDVGTEEHRASRARAVGATLMVVGAMEEDERGKLKEKMERALAEERSVVVKKAWGDALAVLGK